MSQEIIKAAKDYLKGSPNAFAAPLVRRLLQELVESESKLSRVLGEIQQWRQSNKDAHKHSCGAARTIHERLLDKLDSQVSIALSLSSIEKEGGHHE